MRSRTMPVSIGLALFVAACRDPVAAQSLCESACDCPDALPDCAARCEDLVSGASRECGDCLRSLGCALVDEAERARCDDVCDEGGGPQPYCEQTPQAEECWRCCWEPGQSTGGWGNCTYALQVDENMGEEVTTEQYQQCCLDAAGELQLPIEGCSPP